MMSINASNSQLKTIAMIGSDSADLIDLHAQLRRSYCLQIFEDVRNLQDHLKIHPHSIDLAIYTCDQGHENELFRLLDSSSWQKIRTVSFWVLLESDDLTLMRYLFHKGIDDVFCLPLHLSEFLVKLDRALEQKQYTDQFHHICDLTREHFNLKDFTKIEAKLLSLFFSAIEKRFTRHEIIQVVWGRKVSQHQKTLNVHLHNLRKKLVRYGYTILNTSRGEWTIIKTLKVNSQISTVQSSNKYNPYIVENSLTLFKQLP